MGPLDLIKLSPSAADRWMHCKGSAFLAKLKKYESSKYAARGIKAAELLEDAVKDDRSPRDALGESFEVEGHTIVIEQEDVDAVEVMLEDADFAANVSGMDIESEQSIESHIAGAVIKGRFDLLYHDATTIEVTDYKHGVGVAVDAKYNYQLLLYLKGAIEKLGCRDHYSLHIVQPRSRRGAKQSTWRLTHGEYEEILASVTRQILSIQKVAGDFIQRGHFTSMDNFCTGSWCKWCPGELCCPGKAFENVSLAVGGKAILDQDAFTTFTLDHETSTRGSLKKANDAAYQKLSSGQKLEGYKLIKKRAQERWKKNLTKEELASLEKSNLAVSKSVPISITEARKVAEEGGVDLKEYTVKESSGNKVVPASHKGDEVTPVSQMFESL